MLNLIKKSIFDSYKKYEIRKHSLEYLFLEITNECNMSCLHCGSDCKTSSGTPMLTTESWLEIINHIYFSFGNSVRIILTGGEPLLHPNLEFICIHLNNLGFKYGMVTNGWLLSESKIAMLKQHRLHSITISLDGKYESHNKLRNNPNAFTNVSNALKLIAAANFPLSDVVTCVYPQNLNELDEIAAMLVHFNIKRWRLFRIFPSGRAADNNDILLSYEQTRQMLEWIKHNKRKYAEIGLNINLSCEGWLPFEEDKQVRDIPFFCRSGINIASILANGDITGCSNNHESFVQGNVLTENFAFIWNKRFLPFRKRDWIKRTVCNTCEYVKSCQGGSIHLWELDKNRPNFCYVVDLDKKEQEEDNQ